MGSVGSAEQEIKLAWPHLHLHLHVLFHHTVTMHTVNIILLSSFSCKKKKKKKESSSRVRNCVNSTVAQFTSSTYAHAHIYCTHVHCSSMHERHTYTYTSGIEQTTPSLIQWTHGQMHGQTDGQTIGEVFTVTLCGEGYKLVDLHSLTWEWALALDTTVHLHMAKCS